METKPSPEVAASVPPTRRPQPAAGRGKAAGAPVLHRVPPAPAPEWIEYRAKINREPSCLRTAMVWIGTAGAVWVGTFVVAYFVLRFVAAEFGL